MRYAERPNYLICLDITVMDCIIEGFGEMADINYGYVSKQPGYISLYRGREEIKKSQRSWYRTTDTIYF